MQQLDRPLADILRPKSLAEIIGQEHISGNGSILAKLVESKKPISLILWGPPGSGKTSLARILAQDSKADFIELSAVNSSKKDVLRVIDQAIQAKNIGTDTILFIDEIHRFNKAQQDAFLPYVEKGTITLIGATTENPSYEVIAALLSRCRILTLKSLSPKDLSLVISRAIKFLNLKKGSIDQETIDYLASLSGGDARNALNILEVAYYLSKDMPITKELISTAAQTKVAYHDKQGESHYNLISALIKSMRGSNETASFYYLARLMQSGEDPKFIARRMVIFASEDIGLAAPAAINIATSTFLAVERIGMPECEYVLFECAAVLAKSPKSREITNAMQKAKQTALNTSDLAVPLQLRNANNVYTRDLGYSKGYAWQADFKPKKGFLPEELKDINFFTD